MPEFLLEVPPPRDRDVARHSAKEALFMLLGIAFLIVAFRKADAGILMIAGAFVIALTWLLATYVLLYLWNARRREMVHLSDQVLTLESRIGPLRRTRHFDVMSTKVWVETVPSRWEEVIVRQRSRLRLSTDLNWGPIVIQDYRGKLHRFGEGLSGEQAIHVVEGLHDRAHSLRL